MIETNIIQLDNGEEYMLMDEITLDDKNYFYTLGYDSKKDYIDYKNIKFFWHGEDEEGEFVEEIDKKNPILDKLLRLQLVSSLSENPEISEAIEKELDKLEKDGN